MFVSAALGKRDDGVDADAEDEGNENVDFAGSAGVDVAGVVVAGVGAGTAGVLNSEPDAAGAVDVDATGEGAGGGASAFFFASSSSSPFFLASSSLLLILS